MGETFAEIILLYRNFKKFLYSR